MDFRDYAILAALFILALYIWSIPLQNSPFPYGEADSAWHFSIGDYMASQDKVIGLTGLPNYVSWWYYNYNSILGPGSQEYPPPGHINYAIAQIVGGGRVIPVFIYRIIASFIGIFSTYFLIRKLFGIIPAALAATSLVFSIREFMILIFGQQPTLTSIVITPLFLYAYYKFILAWLDGAFDAKYLYASLFLILAQYLLHIQGAMVSVFSVMLFTLLMLIIKRKIPITKTLLAHFGIGILIVLFVAAPFALIYIGAPSEFGKNEEASFARILSWTISHQISQKGGYPPTFVDIFSQYGSIISPFFVSMPFLGWILSLPGLFFLFGIAIMLIRRKPQDLLILSWMIGVYLILHFDALFGVGYGRLVRMVIAEPPMMFSIMAIGAAFFPSLIGLKAHLRTYAKYAMAIFFIAITWFTIGQAQLDFAQNSYPAPIRINQNEIDAANWMKDNLPDNAMVWVVSDVSLPKSIRYAKSRWILAMSQRHANVYSGFIRDDFFDKYNTSYYLLFDYTIMFSQEAYQQMLSLEENLDLELKYSSETIRIYRVILANE